MIRDDKIVLASANRAKLAELQACLQHLSFTIIPQTECQLESVAETGLSFVENAILKARHAAQATGLAALADDSGLVVDALQGLPGIHSARYAGEHATDQDNIDKLLAAMQDIPDEQRGAHFFCVIVLMRHAKDPVPLISQGCWQGVILRAPQGEHGFGYDPVFYLPDHRRTAAQLPAGQKNSISHRGQAITNLIGKL